MFGCTGMWADYTVTNTNLSGAGSLAEGIAQANASTEAFTINFDNSITSLSLDSQLVVSLNAANTNGLTINGTGVTIDMQSKDRAFYFDGGSVTINGLTIKDASVTGGAGGNGGGGGGGGAGLGGAVFINSGSISLNNMHFSGASATGGEGSTGYTDNEVNGGGGGGGMGGGSNTQAQDNQPGSQIGPSDSTVSGGGNGGGPGTGSSFTGGTGGAGGHSGIGVSTEPSDGSDGQDFGGGGGGGAAGASDDGFGDHHQGSDGGSGGNGGFGAGGGGGGQGTNAKTFSVQGGWNGGDGGAGGFGGGGGGGSGGGSSEDPLDGGDGGSGGAAGWGAGAGSTGEVGQFSSPGDGGAGGGGLGAGGAVFVRNGATLAISNVSFSGSEVTAGVADYSWAGSNDGSAYGRDLFAGGDITLSMGNDLTLADNALGGGTSVGSSGDWDNTEADGSLTTIGSGTLTLEGSQAVNTLNIQSLVVSAAESTLTVESLTIGSESGGELRFQGSALNVLEDNSKVVLGLNEGDHGKLSVTNLPDLNVSSIESGAGVGELEINVSEGQGYEFNTPLNSPDGSGELNVTIQGGGEVNFNVANTYTGSTTVSSSQLAVVNANALQNTSALIVEDGEVDVMANVLTIPSLTLNNGTLMDSSGGGSIITNNFSSHRGGNINLNVTATETLQLTDDDIAGNSNTLTLGENKTLTAQSITIGGGMNLVLSQGSTLTQVSTDSPSLILGDSKDGVGTLTVGSDGNAPSIGFEAISGGGNGGKVVFNQSMSTDGSSGEYVVGYALLGNLSVVQQNANGETVLAPVFTNNTYTGGTTVKDGILVVGATDAAGTGDITVEGGQLIIKETTESPRSSFSVTNKVILLGGQYQRHLYTGQSYSVMGDLQSERGSVMSWLGGESSDIRFIDFTVSESSSANNDAIRQSSVFSFNSYDDDLIVIQISDGSILSDSYLAALDSESNLWINVTENNVGNVATPEQMGFQGSFGDFTALYGDDLSSYLGAYGFDVTNDAVWAVINRSSDFYAAVPEPAQYATIMALTCLAGVGLLRRKSR